MMGSDSNNKEGSGGLQAAISNYAENKPKLIRISDSKLENEFKSLISKHKLNGEYDFYCIYEREDGLRYALIYGFYKEKTKLSEHTFQKYALDDALLIHNELKKSGLNIDYIFVLPYLDLINGNSLLFETVVTENI